MYDLPAWSFFDVACQLPGILLLFFQLTFLLIKGPSMWTRFATEISPGRNLSHQREAGLTSRPAFEVIYFN